MEKCTQNDVVCFQILFLHVIGGNVPFYAGNPEYAAVEDVVDAGLFTCPFPELPTEVTI